MPTVAAYRSMHICVDLNGITISWTTVAVGQTILRCAMGQMEGGDLADWLRAKA